MVRRTLPTPFGRLATPHGTPLHGTPAQGGRRRDGRRRQGPRREGPRGGRSSGLRVLRRTPPRNLAHTVDAAALGQRGEPTSRLALWSPAYAARRAELSDVLAVLLAVCGLLAGWQLGQRGWPAAALALALSFATAGGVLLLRRRPRLVRLGGGLAVGLTVAALAGLLAG